MTTVLVVCRHDPGEGMNTLLHTHTTTHTAAVILKTAERSLSPLFSHFLLGTHNLTAMFCLLPPGLPTVPIPVSHQPVCLSYPYWVVKCLAGWLLPCWGHRPSPASLFSLLCRHTHTFVEECVSVLSGSLSAWSDSVCVWGPFNKRVLSRLVHPSESAAAEFYFKECD